MVALGGFMACAPIIRAQDASTNAPAPAPGQRGPRGGGEIQKLIASLDLTADQKPQVMAAIKERREKMTALRDDTAVTGDARKAKAKEIFEACNAKLKTILTPDQFTKWEAAQKNMRPHGQGQAASTAGPDLPTK